MVESGQIRVLLLLKEEKSPEYPNVPILKDLGYNIPFLMLISVIAPKATPDAIVKKLDDAIVKAMKEPAFIKGMKELSLPLVHRSGKEMDAYIAKSYDYYKGVFKEMGLIK